MTQIDFGHGASLYTLEDELGQTVQVTDLGATIVSIQTRDKDGLLEDVVLGYSCAQDYLTYHSCQGATIGRYANRIGGGRFTLNGKELTFPLNDGIHHLHSGPIGFDRKHWQANVLPDALELTLTSPDGESGYPGTITVTVSYRLENGTLTLTYDADTDQDTLCSLTNHSYFNLAGSGSVDSQVLQVSASAYARQDADNVPDGTRASVEGTPMDLRQPVALGTLWEQDFDQIRRYRGIDHHYWADGSGMRAMAKASCPENGITLTVSSDLPGLQVYTGNALNAARGKGGYDYQVHQGFCLETQPAPTPAAGPVEEQPILRKGQHYHTVTHFAFTEEA